MDGKECGNAGTFAVEQTYVTEEYVDHFYDVLPAFKDPRYIQVDGKPFLLIYNVLLVPNLNEFIDCWNKLALENGMKGIHFVGNIMGYAAELKKEEILNSGVDAMVDSSLFTTEKKLSNVGMYWEKFKTRILKLGPERYEYADLIPLLSDEYEHLENVYPAIFSLLDRTPTAGKEAIVITGSTPKLFEKLLSNKVDVVKHKEPEHRIIMVNAWNEWGEGMYLEPDLKYGHGYLDAVRNVVLK